MGVHTSPILVGGGGGGGGVGEIHPASLYTDKLLSQPRVVPAQWVILILSEIKSVTSLIVRSGLVML